MKKIIPALTATFMAVTMVFSTGATASALQSRINEDGNAELFLFGEWIDEYNFRNIMHDLYDCLGKDYVLAFMDEILPTSHNVIWYDGNMDYYVDCLWAKLEREEDQGLQAYSID
ncbi:MAG: hypothetical protein J6F31_04615 [Oscillospiraceae bacterium]|nr:hypothetical protein [Oscillospiraceae bacterium]